MIIYCNSITKRQNTINLIVLFFLGITPSIAHLTGGGVPVAHYPFMILAWLVIFNFLYQLKRTIYSLEFKENQCIITTYWGEKVVHTNELTISISKLTIFKAKVWDVFRLFHDDREIITIGDGKNSYYICNKNGSDKKIHTYLKENSYLN